MRSWPLKLCTVVGHITDFYISILFYFLVLQPLMKLSGQMTVPVLFNYIPALFSVTAARAGAKSGSMISTKKFGPWILAYRSPFQLAPLSLGASRWSSNPVSWLVALCLPTEPKPYIKGQRGQKRQNGFGLLCGVWIWRVRLGWLLLYSSD